MLKLILIKLLNWNNIYFNYRIYLPRDLEIQIGKCSELNIGDKVRAKKGLKISVRDSAKVKIANNNAFNYNTMIVCREKVTLGNNLQCGPNLLIYDHDHEYKT